MKQIYHPGKSRSTQLILWFLPTAVEFVFYILITLLTVIVINTEFIRSYLLVPENFSLQTALLGSLERALTGLVGGRAAATIITAGFWSLIGILVYMILKLFGNFSSELGNDLVVTRYMHPRGDDTYSPIKSLLLKIMVHVFMAAVFVLYINFFIGQLMPFISSSLAGLPAHWSELTYLLAVGKIIIIEIFALHVFVVLSRLLLLRKRVFGLPE